MREETTAADAQVPPRGTCASAPRFAWSVAAVVIGAVALRLVHVIVTRDMPLVQHLVGDAAGYFAWASRIAGGEWIGSESFYQAPLYPYVLAVVFKVLGESVWSVRIVQAAWAGLAVWCLYLAAARLFNHRTGVVAGWMLALYAPSIFFDGIVQKASLGCVLLCMLLAVMACAFSCGDVGSRASPLPGGRGTDRVRSLATWLSLALGAASGLLVLTRENALVWLPILGAWVWLARGDAERIARTGRFARLAMFTVGVALVLVPVGVRNASVGGEWSVSTFQAGPNFYIGNHRGATGRYRPLVRGRETPAFERRDAARLAEATLGRALSARDVSRYWLSRGIEEIRADPGAWLALIGRKSLMVLNRHEVADAESLYVYAEFSPVLRATGGMWHFGVLVPLAAVGIVLTRDRWRKLWVLYALVGAMIAAVALFYVMARYRYPLATLLIPFAAAGCVAGWRAVRLRAFGRLSGALAIGAVAAVAANLPLHDEGRLSAHAWMNVGVALAERGDVAEATTYFRRAVAGDPTSAEANNNLAQALAIQGDFSGAIPHYETALRAAPTLMGLDFNLAVALEHVGRPDDALRHYERAVELDPEDAEARAAMKRLRTTG